MRNSKQRNAILTVLKESYDHPTADVVHERVKKVIPNISLGTVYRDLKQLEENGLITVVESSDSKVHYEGHLEEHLHFLCEKCGEITDVFCKSYLPEGIEQLKNKGFSVHSQKTVYYGICPLCKKQEETEKNK